ncbi:hypothetical protein EDEG_01875 [Edhazardia aedis USNM 41457]|uniref:Uncharacterized protein n=1 Tax=Edhazardia aedis (strain USNM 41457) TaxID=1003232 RepID=J9D7Q6_EDHAE|nr:hypothetical protein EDEG_01875 [Edhazardia aedis USNM 41457]|eukprot:EJW03831.1 hypothetical protein EDEG_01875 [Edhazardia aedis USNM 41457]
MPKIEIQLSISKKNPKLKFNTLLIVYQNKHKKTACFDVINIRKKQQKIRFKIICSTNYKQSFSIFRLSLCEFSKRSQERDDRFKIKISDFKNNILVHIFISAKGIILQLLT